MRILLFFLFVFPIFAYNLAPELRRETVHQFDLCPSEFEENAPKTNQLLNEIKNYLAQNSPETFSNDLASEEICIGLVRGAQRAWAKSNLRLVNIESGLIMRVRNLNELAFVISHELAHLSMRHTPLEGNPLPGSSNAIVSLLMNQYQRKFQELLDLGKDAPQEVLRQYQEELRNINLAIRNEFLKFFDDEFYANWMESEADFIGAHFYLRAGFPFVDVGWRNEQLVTQLVEYGIDPTIAQGGNGFDPHGPVPKMTSQEREQLAISACKAETEVPRRGSNRYALPCWSVWDLKVNYRNYFSTINQAADFNSSITLEEIQAEVRSLSSAPRPVKP